MSTNDNQTDDYEEYKYKLRFYMCNMSVYYLKIIFITILLVILVAYAITGLQFLFIKYLVDDVEKQFKQIRIILTDNVYDHKLNWSTMETRHINEILQLTSMNKLNEDNIVLILCRVFDLILTLTMLVCILENKICELDKPERPIKPKNIVRDIELEYIEATNE